MTTVTTLQHPNSDSTYLPPSVPGLAYCEPVTRAHTTVSVTSPTLGNDNLRYRRPACPVAATLSLATCQEHVATSIPPIRPPSPQTHASTAMVRGTPPTFSCAPERLGQQGHKHTQESRPSSSTPAGCLADAKPARGLTRQDHHQQAPTRKQLNLTKNSALPCSAIAFSK